MAGPSRVRLTVSHPLAPVDSATTPAPQQTEDSPGRDH
jgi:hypothetical protein